MSAGESVPVACAPPLRDAAPVVPGPAAVAVAVAPLDAVVVPAAAVTAFDLTVILTAFPRPPPDVSRGE